VAEVRWSLTAAEDLRLLEEWIARDSPLNAVDFTDRLIASVERLADLPLSGRKVREFDDDSVREIIFRGYRIVYLLKGSQMTILRVVQGARDLRKLSQQEPWSFE
jgi:plasmid stabilization system protein ParE